MSFERRYIVSVNEPGQELREYGFNDPNDMRTYISQVYEACRNGHFDERTIIKKDIIEISIAGDIYASLSAIEYEEEQIEDWEEEFYDEVDFEDGSRTLSSWAIEALIDHVFRINDFNKGGLWKDHIIDLLESYEYTTEDMDSFYLLERNKIRYKPTELLILYFEDGSKLYILNPENKDDQEQGFGASLIHWNGEKYIP